MNSTRQKNQLHIGLLKYFLLQGVIDEFFTEKVCYLLYISLLDVADSGKKNNQKNGSNSLHNNTLGNSGRFISPDPMQQGINHYIYAGNNPSTMIDPDGLYFGFYSWYNNWYSSQFYNNYAFNSSFYDFQYASLNYNMNNYSFNFSDSFNYQQFQYANVSFNQYTNSDMYKDQGWLSQIGSNALHGLKEGLLTATGAGALIPEIYNFATNQEYRDNTLDFFGKGDWGDRNMTRLGMLTAATLGVFNMDAPMDIRDL
ncbi:MAG: hypothetical protein K8S14_07665, partial [Actinomycetia bacterium]|nr:hypothetical protein [Actinomycetes bacterium]